MIRRMFPGVGYGKRYRSVLPSEPRGKQDGFEWPACLNSFVFDYVARSKVRANTSTGTSSNNSRSSRPPPIPAPSAPKPPPKSSRDQCSGSPTPPIDMRPFARDMGYDGEPSSWNEDERRHFRARLDALYFHPLWRSQSEDDIRYILSTFPIVERKDRAANRRRLPHRRTDPLVLPRARRRRSERKRPRP